MAMRQPMNHKRRADAGSVMIEFVLVASCFFIPLVLGLMSIGFALTRALQVASLTRDVGRMAVRGVDFSLLPNQELITGSSTRPNLPPMASGLGMQPNGGNVTGGVSGMGVLVLSTFTRASATCGCDNAGMIVLTRRIVIGNKTLFTSTFGTPTSTLVNPSTGVVANYLNEVTARANTFASIVNLSNNEQAHMVESMFSFQDLAIGGLYSNPGVFWRAVF
jgi:hypothetical protein